MNDIRPPRPRASMSRLPKVQPQAQPSVKPLENRNSSPAKRIVLQRPVEASKPVKRRRWLWIVGVIVVAIVAATAGMIIWYNDALQPLSTSEKWVKITIESGATIEHVADELQQKKLVKSSLALQLYARVHNKNQLHVGAYIVSAHQRPSDILEKLVGGDIDTFNVTILPGKTLEDIKTKLEDVGFEASAIEMAFTKQYDHPLLQSKPKDVNLEGYIFPETYQITSDTTVEQLLLKTFDELYTRIQQKEIEPAIAARGLTLHQAITLASLVQLEVSNDAERRQVAQIFETRLALGMPLGSDVTYLYAAKITGLQPSIGIDSPYNTRKYPGLPPGAIANFNLPSLEAVANPAPGDYLFFVSGDDGVTHFSRTEEAHQQNINQYCTKLCSQE